MLDQLAVRRDIYAMTRFAPGVTQDTFGPSFYGSTSAENSLHHRRAEHDGR